MKNFEPTKNLCEICGKSKSNKLFNHTICSKIKQKRRLDIDAKAPARNRPALTMRNCEGLVLWANHQYSRLAEGT